MKKVFNSTLMNKLIRIEWVSAIRLPTKLIDVTSHPWAKINTVMRWLKSFHLTLWWNVDIAMKCWLRCKMLTSFCERCAIPAKKYQMSQGCITSYRTGSSRPMWLLLSHLSRNEASNVRGGQKSAAFIRDLMSFVQGCDGSTISVEKIEE